MKVRKAVIPAAGLGTRFLPATKAQSKQMIEAYDEYKTTILGRYIINPNIFEILEHTKPGKGGEIQLTEIFS